MGYTTVKQLKQLRRLFDQNKTENTESITDEKIRQLLSLDADYRSKFELAPVETDENGRTNVDFSDFCFIHTIT